MLESFPYIKYLLTLVGLALLCRFYDYIFERTRAKWKAGAVIFAILTASVWLLYWNLALTEILTWWAGAVGYWLLLVYPFYLGGKEIAAKYWQNEYERFYAYGMMFLILGFACFLFVIGFGSSSPEDAEPLVESHFSLGQRVAFFFLAFSWTLVPAWFGVHAEHKKRMKTIEGKSDDS